MKTKLFLKILYRNIAIYKLDMGATNTEYFTESQNELAKYAKALGHPARIAILEYLVKIDSCICNDIVNELPLAQPTISQHLKELKNAGFIKGNIKGNAICYCIDKETWGKFEKYLVDLISKKDLLNCC